MTKISNGNDRTDGKKGAIQKYRGPHTHRHTVKQTARDKAKHKF